MRKSCFASESLARPGGRCTQAEASPCLSSPQSKSSIETQCSASVCKHCGPTYALTASCDGRQHAVRHCTISAAHGMISAGSSATQRPGRLCSSLVRRTGLEQLYCRSTGRTTDHAAVTINRFRDERPSQSLLQRLDLLSQWTSRTPAALCPPWSGDRQCVVGLPHEFVRHRFMHQNIVGSAVTAH